MATFERWHATPSDNTTSSDQREMPNPFRSFNWFFLVAGFLSATNSVLHHYLLQDSSFHHGKEETSLLPLPSSLLIGRNDSMGETTVALEAVSTHFRVRSRVHKSPPPPNTNIDLTMAQENPNRLRVPYLNVTQLKQTGHFDQIVTAWAKPFQEKSVEICSLERRKKISRIQRQEFLKKNQRPPIYTEPIQGMYYVKVPKSGSSTLAGINQRIALRWGWRLHGSATNETTGRRLVVLSPTDKNLSKTTCTHAEGHIYDAGRYYGNRIPKKSFLWGSIRDPASRALSRVFFSQISQSGEPDNDQTVLRALKKSHHPQFGTTSEGTGGFQLQYLAMNSMDPWFAWNRNFPTMVQQYDLLEAWVKNVTEQYDFIALAERMEESLVVLQLLLGLPVGDILQSSSKIGGGYHVVNETCVQLKKATKSRAVVEYLESDEWQAFNYGDYLLYAIVNRSLDLTIESLGKERFHAALATFRATKQIVDEKCVMETYFPCSTNGTLQVDLSRRNCYRGDEGCGYPCIDRTTTELGL